MKKKLALLLCLVLLVTALALPASADNSAAWDGSVDTSWYSAEAKTFEISTPAQLAGLAAIVNGKADGITADNFAGKTVTLTADLDLGGVKGSDGTWSGQAWTPIGNSYGNSFMGLFNGNGHAISNYYLNVQMGSCAGLFGYLENAAIRNLKTDGSIRVTADCQSYPVVGGIAACVGSYSGFTNCKNAIAITVDEGTVLNGNGVGGTGAVGSRALDEAGVVIDKPLEMERWVATCGNRCRESLVGKWFRESERCMNWLLDMAEAHEMGVMVTVGSRSAIHPEADCYHMLFGGPLFEEHSMADAVEYMFMEEAQAAGAEALGLAADVERVDLGDLNAESGLNSVLDLHLTGVLGNFEHILLVRNVDHGTFGDDGTNNDVVNVCHYANTSSMTARASLSITRVLALSRS